VTDGCTLNAIVANVQPITAVVAAQTALTASLSIDELSASLVDPSPLSGSVVEPETLGATVEEAQAITAVVESLTELAAEIQTMGMTAAQIAKLNSIAWNARNYQPDYITLVRATAYSVADGDSTPWTLTTSLGEVTQWAVAHPAWRGSGIMEIDATLKYKQSGAARVFTIELQTADDYQTDNTSTATSTFGLPQSWSTVLTLASASGAATSTEETQIFHIDLIHEGNTSTTGFNQTAVYRLDSSDSGASPTVHTVTGITTTNIDTSKDFLMRMRFKVAALSGTDYAKVVSSYVGLKHPRDGHAY